MLQDVHRYLEATLSEMETIVQNNLEEESTLGAETLSAVPLDVDDLRQLGIPCG